MIYLVFISPNQFNLILAKLKPTNDLIGVNLVFKLLVQNQNNCLNSFK